MKELQMIVCRSLNNFFVVIGLLVVDFTSLTASNAFVHDSTDNSSVNQNQTTDQSSSDESIKNEVAQDANDEPDAYVYLKVNFIKKWGIDSTTGQKFIKSSNLRVEKELIDRKQTCISNLSGNDKMIMHLLYKQILDLHLNFNGLDCPGYPSIPDHARILKYLDRNCQNIQTYDIYIEGRRIPGTTDGKLVGQLRIQGEEFADLAAVEKIVDKIILDLQKVHVDVEAIIYPYSN